MPCINRWATLTRPTRLSIPMYVLMVVLLICASVPAVIAGFWNAYDAALSPN